MTTDHISAPNDHDTATCRCCEDCHGYDNGCNCSRCTDRGRAEDPDDVVYVPRGI